MRRIKIITALILAIFTLFVSMGWLTFRRSADFFPTHNPVRDIEFISARHHSVEHPAERAVVRGYLYDRLKSLGGQPEICRYDSIANVYCKFEPSGADTSSAYLLLVAHLDSRFPEQTPQGEVCSYGAADDGYGLAVILELVDKALDYSGEWRQGLKVLFTDSEERNLDGVRTALEMDNSQFDNVGLVVNVEARGVRGPALLFESSADNDRLMDFYVKHAGMPYTYSLTSAVYGMMPNYTDFTYLKPLFPGYNFSVIDNLHYYHNDKDNFSNISPAAIAHYGVQLEPMLKAFLTSEQFSDPDYFIGEEDNVVFTLPGLGTINLSRTGNYLLNAAALVLFVLVLLLYTASGRVRLAEVFANAVKTLVYALLAALVSTGIVYLASRLAGVPFSFFSLKYLRGDWLLASGILFVTAALYVGLFAKRVRRSEDFVFGHLLGLSLTVVIISAVLLLTVGENLFLLLPLFCILTGLLLHIFVHMNIVSLPAFLLVELAGAPFLYNLYTALTVGSLGIIVFLAYIYIAMIASLMRLFMYQRI